eukprot:CAMPEP_0182420066 /NCGR_PEP_ID=MMETSP1167-20130531/4584_1 /TAXON_ID=2988 /ORGANISM="Mallomonas Sp, Strain CCMP3275" /LENGTH=38 /DNA_ID= /DNA_START= /DNA_END= /DNA_ORIENTATION=
MDVGTIPENELEDRERVFKELNNPMDVGTIPVNELYCK